LLEISVRRTLGVREIALSEQEIGALLDRTGIGYVVAQDDFWTDLPVMARLQQVLRSPHFQQVARIPIVANVPTEDRTLLIYRNTVAVAQGSRNIDLNLPIIGRKVEGVIGR